MPTLKITITVTDGSNQFEETITLDFDQLKKTPNPRQAVDAYVRHRINLTCAEAGIDFSI